MNSHKFSVWIALHNKQLSGENKLSFPKLLLPGQHDIYHSQKKPKIPKSILLETFFKFYFLVELL